MVQEAVADQLKNLEEKLHEYKVRHKADEEAVEDEIATLEDTLAGLGFMTVVDFATSDFETCPKYQNWANFINKSTTESQILRS